MPLRCTHGWTRFVMALLAITTTSCNSEAQQTSRAQKTPQRVARHLTVPQLPDGTPKQLLAFVDGLLPPKRQPRSHEEYVEYRKAVALVSIQAADRVLAQTKEGDPLHAEAAVLEIDSLTLLSRLGDEAASRALDAFASDLSKSPVESLAMLGKRTLLASIAQSMVATGDLSDADAFVARLATFVASDPDDDETARLATQIVGQFEHMPEAAGVAILAIKSLIPIFERSDNEEIRELADAFKGKLRLLGLPGNPMTLSGTLLNGRPFDQSALAGKVILVDFWATWCGPCIAEMPTMLAAYEKYHDKGFEIVGFSLDEERSDVESFVSENRIPWPILFAGKGWEDPVVEFYGISGIPQMVLIGRDGKVITLDARGEKLEERLAELFKDAD